MKTLDEIALYWGTDKSSKWHGYTAVYEEYLPKNIMRMLEIGAAKGHSALMWRDYFDHGFQLHLIDMFADPDHVNERWCRSKGFVVYKGDTRKSETFDQVSEIFDVIIEDGGHVSSSQILAFKHLFLKNLKPGGIMFIEDLHACLEDFYRDGLALNYEDTIRGMFEGSRFVEGGDKKKGISNPYFTKEEAKEFESEIEWVKFFCDDKLLLIKRK